MISATSGKDIISNAEMDNYFDSFIRECLKDLRSNKSVYAFYQEQVDEIKKVFPHLNISKNDGIFILTRLE
jgi:hypothetical protein